MTEPIRPTPLAGTNRSTQNLKVNGNMGRGLGEGPDASLFTREPGQHVHVSWAREWAQAARSLVTDLEDYRWDVPYGLQPGDILVTVLDCTPRLVACIERIKAVTPEETTVEPGFNFSQPITVSHVEVEAGVSLPSSSAPLADEAADRVLAALRRLTALPPSAGVVATDCADTAAREEWSAVVVARVLQQVETEENDRATCAGCGSESAELEGHFFSPAHGAITRAIQDVVPEIELLCRDCHDLCHVSSLGDVRKIRNPQCPKCGTRNPLTYLWGMPSNPPGDDVILGGCDIPDGILPQWQCRNQDCGESYAVVSAPARLGWA